MGKNWWIRFGCFLTGYNYDILLQSSEVSHKLVKKYTAAILIVGILWSLISFQFANHYLEFGLMGSVIASLIGVIIIIQIERQIILAVSPGILLLGVRVALALVMAVIGAVVTDSMLFEEDIRRQREKDIGAEVQEVVASRSKEIDRQLEEEGAEYEKIDSTKTALLEQLEAKPDINSVSITYDQVVIQELQLDTISGEMIAVDVVKPLKKREVRAQKNPKWDLIPDYDENLAKISLDIKELRNRKLYLEEIVTKDLQENSGFLTELLALITILEQNFWAAVVWGLFFAFVMMLELLVLFAKFSSSDTDYDKIILHQRATRIKTLVNL